MTNIYRIDTTRWKDDERTEGQNQSATIVCEDMQAVWDWLEPARLDSRTEILSIRHVGIACAIIPPRTIT